MMKIEVKKILHDDGPSNYLEFKHFLEDLFVQNKLYNDIEFVYKGNLRIVRAKFWHGPFNINPIQFECISNQFGEFYSNILINKIIGALSINPCYFLIVKNNELFIDKTPEGC